MKTFTLKCSDLITIQDKMSIFNYNVDIFSNNFDEEYSGDSDDSDEENFDTKIQMKKVNFIKLI